MILNKNFLLLLQGIGITSLGSSLSTVVYILWLIDVAGSGSLVGLFLFVAGVPVIIMNFFGGVFADRYSRVGLIIFTDCLIGLIVLILSLVFFLFDDVMLKIISLFVAQFLMGIVGGISPPAFFSLIPDILPASRLAMGNVLLNLASLATQFLGRSVGGLLFVLWSVPALLTITGVCFLLSALSERFICVPSKPIKKDVSSDSNPSGGFMSVLEDIKPGVFYVLKNKKIRHVFIIRLGYLWCLGGLLVTLPFLVDIHYNEGTEYFGYLMAIHVIGIAAGSALGGVNFNYLSGLRSRALLYRVSVLAIPLLCSGLSVFENIYAAFLLIFFVGFSSSGTADTLMTTQLQLTTPDDLRGRVMSVFVMTSSLTIIFSFFNGVLIDLLDKDVALVQFISGVVGCFIIYPLLLNNTWLSFMAYSAAAEKS